MVVGQAPILYASALPPLHFSTQMCSMPATAQGYSTPPGTTVSSPTMPCASSPTQCLQPSSPLTPRRSVSPPMLPPPVSCNPLPIPGSAVVTYTPVTTNLYNGISVMPVSPNVAIPCKATDNQISSSVFPYPPVYTCSQPIPTSSIVPCQTRVINGAVLQCAPGLCQYALPTELCTVNSTIPYGNNYQISNIPSIAQTICSTNVVSPWKQSYGMEQVWRKEFSNLFNLYTRQYQHIWILLPVNERPGGVWYENVDSAKVRFCCDTCGHGWTSMKGRVAFWFILNYASNEGVVCLKLYGQQCDRCKNGDYEPAMWYPEEVIKVIANIYNRVGEAYYGFQQVPYHKNRRPGKPRTPHNSNLCQACKDGLCAERR